MGDFIRSHSGIPHKDDFVVMRILVKNIKGVYSLAHAPVVLLPQTVVNKVMEIDMIIIGIGLVGGFSIAALVKGVFDLKNRIDYLESFLEDTDTRIDVVTNKNTQHFVSELEAVNEKLKGVVPHLVSLINSKVDNLEGKLRADVTSGTEILKVIEESKKTNKRLDEFIETFQAQ